jgi:hypothetical protein
LYVQSVISPKQFLSATGEAFLPGESGTLEVTVLLPKGKAGPISGRVIVEVTNVTTKAVSIRMAD